VQCGELAPTAFQLAVQCGELAPTAFQPAVVALMCILLLIAIST